MKRIFKTITSFPKAFLAITLCFTLFFAYFSTKLEVDASSQTLLLENDKDLKKFREISKRYETPNFLVVAYSPKDDILDPKSLETIHKLSKKLESLDFVQSVLSILNVPLFENHPMQITDLLGHIPSLKDENVSLENAKKEFLSSPLYASNLVSDDFKTTAIVINLIIDEKYYDFIKARDELLQKQKDSKLSVDEKAKLEIINSKFKTYRDINRQKEAGDIEAIRQILDEFRPAQTLFLGGVNMIASDMIEFVKNDIVFYGLLSTLLLMGCLWLFFRQIRFVICPIFICLVSAICASGLFGFLGFEITVISSNYVALQIVITMSVVIHLIVAYREKLRLHPDFSQKALVYLALRDRANPCFFAVFTTVIGFFSLILCDIKPIIMLGIMMSVSISFSLVIAFVVFGSLMSLLKKRRVNTKFEDGFRLTFWCANLAIYHRKIVYIFAFLALVVGLIGASKLKVENSVIGYFKQSTEIYAGMDLIDKKLGGTVPFDVVIKFKDDEKISSGDEFLDEFESEFDELSKDEKYWFEARKMRIIKMVDEFLKNREFVGYVGSFNILLEIGKSVNDGKDLDDFMLSVIYNEIPESYKDIVITPYINIEANEAHFSARTYDSDPNLQRDKFLKELKLDLENLLKDENVEVEISGLMVLYNNMLQSLFSSQADTLIFVVGVLFVLFIVIFRSVRFAFIAIVVNVIPLTLVFGIMGFMKISLDIMTITIAAISIGIGVDDVIHYIYRLKQERLTKGLKDAVLVSHASIGYAMYYTSFAIFLGFLIMCASNFWPTIHFGILIDLVMVCMLTGALVLLPTMILSMFRDK
ncbi:MAG: MMPL family transporter [Campylobacter sp.]|nr:MMPL family transporter [Campylobacter sp.]